MYDKTKWKSINNMPKTKLNLECIEKQIRKKFGTLRTFDNKRALH